MKTYNQSVFFCENNPMYEADYDPVGRKTGWYYMDKHMVPVGPFSSYPQATYASARNLPAPEIIGKIVERTTY